MEKLVLILFGLIILQYFLSFLQIKAYRQKIKDMKKYGFVGIGSRSNRVGAGNITHSCSRFKRQDHQVREDGRCERLRQVPSGRGHWKVGTSARLKRRCRNARIRNASREASKKEDLTHCFKPLAALKHPCPNCRQQLTLKQACGLIRGADQRQ